jgi:hypothetical protein
VRRAEQRSFVLKRAAGFAASFALTSGVMACALLAGLDDSSLVPGDGAGDGANESGDAAPDAGEACVPELPIIVDASDKGHLATCNGSVGVELLIDSMNCGRCGHACPAACVGGLCSPSSAAVPADFVQTGFAAGDEIYWFGTAFGRIRYTLDTDPEPIAVTDPDGGTLDSFVAAATDGRDTFLARYGTTAALVRLIDGQPPARSVVTDAFVRHFTFDGDDVVYVSGGNPDIRRVKKDGTNPRFQVVSNGSDPYPFLIAPKAGGGVFVLLRDENMPRSPAKLVAVDASVRALLTLSGADGLAADETHVYVGDTVRGAILRLPVDARLGDQPEVVALHPEEPVIKEIALDGTNVYWASGAPSDGGNLTPYERLWKRAKCGGPEVPLTNVVYSTGGIVVRMGDVYYGSGNSLVRVR